MILEPESDADDRLDATELAAVAPAAAPEAEAAAPAAVQPVQPAQAAPAALPAAASEAFPHEAAPGALLEPIEPAVPVRRSKSGRVISKGSTAGLRPGVFTPKWDWEPVRAARVRHGWNAVELSEKFGIPEGTIRIREQKERWPSATEVKRRNEQLASLGDTRATQEVFERWMGCLRLDLTRNLEEILREGPTNVRNMTLEEVKVQRSRLELLQAYQSLILSHQTQGAKLRALEREEHPAEHDPARVDMSALVVFYRSGAAQSTALGETVIDCTSEAQARDRAARELPSAQLPMTSALVDLAPLAAKAAGVAK